MHGCSASMPFVLQSYRGFISYRLFTKPVHSVEFPEFHDFFSKKSSKCRESRYCTTNTSFIEDVIH